MISYVRDLLSYRLHFISIITILFFLWIPYAQVLAEDFTDNFDTGFTNWYRTIYNSARGSDNDPAPRIDASFGKPAPSLDVNGDSWCGNGAYTKQVFDYTQGLTIEWDMYVASGFDWNWGKGGLSDHAPRLVRQRGDGAFIDDLRCGTSHLATIQLIDDGNFNRQPASLTLGIRAEDGSFQQFRDNDARNLQNAWHHYMIQIQENGVVNFYIDDILVWTPTKKLDFSRGPLPILFGDRDANGPVRIDNVTVTGVVSLVIRPNKGGDTGVVTARIFGSNFVDGTTVKLSRIGEADIDGASTKIESEGSLTTTFDLVSRTRGPWDVVVTYPDNSTKTLADGFTIEEGQKVRVWADIVGRNVIRVGRAQRFHILYGNRSNVDAEGAFLFLRGIPLGATLRTNFGFVVTSVPTDDKIEPDAIPLAFKLGNEQIIQIQLDPVPPGFTGTLSVEITTGSTVPFTLQAVGIGP